MVDFAEPLQPPPPHQQYRRGTAVGSYIDEFGLMLLPNHFFKTDVIDVVESTELIASDLRNLAASIDAVICNAVYRRTYQARRDIQNHSIFARQLRSSPS
jgi:hypothetical protein